MCIGVGGADAVDVMAGLPWELKCPNVSPFMSAGWAQCPQCVLVVLGHRGTAGGQTGRVDSS